MTVKELRPFGLDPSVQFAAMFYTFLHVAAPRQPHKYVAISKAASVKPLDCDPDRA